MINEFKHIRVGLASPEQIRTWSSGEVKKPETINYRTLKPERQGLFCEKIFGPTKDWECYCGRYKSIRYKGIICDKCKVEVTQAKVRRTRMGHIELKAPVCHIWYLKGVPSYISILLDMSVKDVEGIVYYEHYVVTDGGKSPFKTGHIFAREEEYLAARDEHGRKFEADIGAGAVAKLLAQLPLKKLAAELKIQVDKETQGLAREDREQLEALDKDLRAASERTVVELVNDRVEVFGAKTPLGRKLKLAVGRAKKAKDGDAKKELQKSLDDILALGGKDPRESKPVRRLKVITSFLNSGNKPEWMILGVLPVIPPDLRPMVQLEGGRFATSDINDLYRRVINRNNRLERLFQLNAPEIIIRNEKRMLQEAVDALFDNGRRGRIVRGPGNRALKSLSDLLRGKQGRFRQNLLGKRVDYSGRSVIVIDPKLKFNQCGLPKQMALELFKPFIMNKLVERKLVSNIRSAKKLIERASNDVWDVLEEITAHHPVLLNRAPTLHRLGIQAFEPVLIEGKAIRLHPLVCTAFNADFDGDQMAVHVPLSRMAQLEARFLMLSTNNLLLPGNGKPVATPTQDMVIGLYYLTALKPGAQPADRELPVYGDIAELEHAYLERQVHLHDAVHFRTREGQLVRTTAGRAFLNDRLPAGLEFVNETLDKKSIAKLITRCFEKFGSYRTIVILDTLKNIGFEYATVMGTSISIRDVVMPKEKDRFIADADKEVQAVEKAYLRGQITDDDRYNRVVDIWTRATNSIRDVLYDHLKADQGGLNPLYLMSASGARGSIDQIKQLGGIRGLMAKPSGKIIELPIKSNFRQGLTVLEYFISTHGARKGLADTALKTSDAGYLTRRLSDVAQETIVTQQDCGTMNGVVVTALREGDEERESLYDRILGRVALENIKHPETGEVLVKAGMEITEPLAKQVEDAGVQKVKIRTVLTCEADTGVCVLCYGRNMATGRLVEEGEPVGIIAAQSIGEPGTQLTMRTFHVGGIAMGSGGFKEASYEEPVYVSEVPARTVKCDSDIVVMQQSELTFRSVRAQLKVPEGARILAGGVFVAAGDPIMEIKGADGKRERVPAPAEGILHFHETKNQLLVLGREQRILLPTGTKLLVGDDELVPAGTKIAEFDAFNELILCRRSGKVAFADIRPGRTLREDVDENTGMSVRVITEDKEKELQPRLVLKVRGEEAEDIYDLPYQCQLMVKDGEHYRAGDILAKIPKALSKTKDITGGLPRVEDLFEARQRADRAQVAEIDGTVKINRNPDRPRRGVKKGSLAAERSPYRLVTVQGKAQKKEYKVPFGLHLKVQDGDHIEAGTALTDGPVSPYDILKVRGVAELQKYLLNEVQEVYRGQGVTIADKHIEVIIRQMLRKVLITRSGDTPFLVGELVDRQAVQKRNAVLKAKGEIPAEYEDTLLGVTKASLATESFISAASFQETRRILAEAAIRGAEDTLRGLKENVVIGHLIPAGTGKSVYHDRNTDYAALEKKLAAMLPATETHPLPEPARPAADAPDAAAADAGSDPEEK